MITAVSFDLWETLITDTPELSRVTERLRLERLEGALDAGGFGTAARAIEKAYREVWHRCHQLYWSADQDISCRRQIEHFLEALDLNASSFDEETLMALEEAYAGAAIDALPAAVRGGSALLVELRGRGLKVGLVSNTGRTPGSALRHVLQRLGLGPFDVMVFSNEHGACKPQRSIFDELQRGLGVPSEEVVFVGDNLYADVHGAQSAGMRAVHFVPPVRGAAVAPAVEHGLTILPEATIGSLSELPAVIDALSG